MILVLNLHRGTSLVVILQIKWLEYLKKVPSFQPIDVLVSQLDRPSINKMLNYLNQGVVKSLFIDSGCI